MQICATVDILECYADLANNEDEILCNGSYKSYAVEIIERKYEEISTKDVVKAQKHLTPLQQRMLKKVLDNNVELFDGKLGLYPHKKFKLELEENATPSFQQAYPIPF